MDVLDELTPQERKDLVKELRSSLGVTKKGAESILRASEPFWNAIEDAGPLVDAWGGGEFRELFPRMMAVITQ